MPELSVAKKAKVLIVDDHPAVREALSNRIGRQSDMEVCGEAADANEAIRLIDLMHPEVAVIDITLKTGNGIDLIKRIKEGDDHLSIVVWSMHPESLYAERALRAGALGYVNKDEATDTIVQAIRRVREGRLWLSDGMMNRLTRQSFRNHSSEAARSPVELLADREFEVFRMIGQGYKTTEIANRLHLSANTVATYRDRIRRKLGLSDGTTLAQYATRWELGQNHIEELPDGKG